MDCSEKRRQPKGVARGKELGGRPQRGSAQGNATILPRRAEPRRMQEFPGAPPGFLIEIHEARRKAVEAMEGISDSTPGNGVRSFLTA